MVRAMIPLRTRFPHSLTDLRSEMEGLFDLAFNREGVESGGLIPRINISETDTHYEVAAELPGMKSDDVHVELNDGQLSISGELKAESEEEGKTYHRVERRYGEFRRVISVPDTVDAEKIKAEFHDGLLSVSLPKSEKEKPKRIEVKGS